RAGRGGRRVRGPVAVLARLTRGGGAACCTGARVPRGRQGGRCGVGTEPRPMAVRLRERTAPPWHPGRVARARPPPGAGGGPCRSRRAPGGAGGGGVPWRCAVPKRGGRLESGTGSGNTRVPGGRGRVAPVSRTRAVRCGPRRERGRPVPTPWRYP